MPVTKEVKDFFSSLRLFFLGKEPNLIPLSGLTLGPIHLNKAREWIQQQDSFFQEEGPVKALEKAIEDYHGGGRTIAMSSGRASLSLILRSLKLNKGDKILTCGFTCIAVANSITFEGLVPVYYDIELDTYGPDLEDVERKHRDQHGIKAIIIQHTFGLIGNQAKAVIAWARSHGLYIIEDVCHAFGARQDDQIAGTLGDAAFFSFERSKSLSTFQGGAALFHNEELTKRAKAVVEGLPKTPPERTRALLRQFIFTYQTQRSDGRWWRRLSAKAANRGQYIPGTSEEEIKGVQPEHYWERLSPALADLALDQVNGIDHFNAIRRQKAEEWEGWAKQKGYATPKLPPNSQPAWLRYPILVPESMKHDTSWGKGLGIEVGVWYVSNLHPTDQSVENCPHADEAVARCVNLPINTAFLL